VLLELSFPFKLYQVGWVDSDLSFSMFISLTLVPSNFDWIFYEFEVAEAFGAGLAWDAFICDVYL
jgi:hypothetical protein